MEYPVLLSFCRKLSLSVTEMSELIFDNGAKCSANGIRGREKAFYSLFPGACVVNEVTKFDRYEKTTFFNLLKETFKIKLRNCF